MPNHHIAPLRYLFLALLLVGFNLQLQAGIITLNNGALQVQVLDTNGAINSVTFGGTEFFQQGIASSIADWGLQNNDNISTFAKNEANGTTGIPVSVSPSLTVTGNYLAPLTNVLFSRSYALVPHCDVLRITTTFTNQGSALELTYFDTFDPDQGVDFGLGNSTFNDLFLLGGPLVAQASIDSGLALPRRQHTVIVGSTDPRALVSAGGLFSVFDGDDLNFIIDNQYDGENLFVDEGTHLGIRTNLAVGATTQYTFDLAFGLTPSAAQTAFMIANPIPEPSYFWCFAGAIIAGRFVQQHRRSRLRCC